LKTPLGKKVAEARLVVVLCVGVIVLACGVMGMIAYLGLNGVRAAQDIDLWKMSFLWFGIMLLGLAWIATCVGGLRRSDAFLRETFERCPICLEASVECVMKGYRVNDWVICRQCGAKWQIVWNLPTSDVRYLPLKASGKAMTQEIKLSMPPTDNPEEWREWARERSSARESA
jgi:hypothetical protein